MPPKKASAPTSSPIAIPTWMLSWLLISSLLVVYDAAFVLTRPASFPKGSLHWLFFPYDSYVQYDPVYLDVHDTFGIAQAWINLLEVAVILLALVLTRVLPSSSVPHILLVIATSSTLFKTLLYFTYDHVSEHKGKYALVDPRTWDAGYVGTFVVPTMCWVLFPAAVLVSLGGQFAEVATGKRKGKKA